MSEYKGFKIPPRLVEYGGLNATDLVKCIEELDLDWIIGYIKTNNPSGNLPYHNNQHMFSVAVIADFLYMQEVDYVVDRERRWLMVSALLHDYDHTGGREPDYKNVSNARMAVPQIYRPHSAIISHTIAVTTYPFTRAPVALIEQCLRDADLLHPILAKDPQVVMVGLREELNHSRKTPVTLEGLVRAQGEFLRTAEFFTITGKALFLEYFEQHMDEIRAYAKENSDKTV